MAHRGLRPSLSCPHGEQQGREGKAPAVRKPATSRGLVREVTYLHEDEEAGIVAYAKRQRCSKAEAIRRAVRAFLRIEN